MILVLIGIVMLTNIWIFLGNPIKVDFKTPIDDALNNIQLLFQTLNDMQIYELANDSNITLGMLEPT